MEDALKFLMFLLLLPVVVNVKSLIVTLPKDVSTNCWADGGEDDSKTNVANVTNNTELPTNNQVINNNNNNVEKIIDLEVTQ